MGAKQRMGVSGAFAVCVLFSVFLISCDMENNDEAFEYDGPAIRVGVLDGWGTNALIAVLNADDNIDAFIMPRLRADVTEECDVLIVTQQRAPALLTRSIMHLHSLVNEGGGALFLHDAVGYRAHMAAFPMVGRGTYHPKLDTVRVAKEHPLTSGLEIGQTFSPGFKYDHVIIEPGAEAVAVIDNENDDPVVVAGKAGEGRVVLSGMLTGHRGTPEDSSGVEAEPEGEELRLLLNSIYWLAGVK